MSTLSRCRSQAVVNIAPNWFTSVMGTAIVATAAASLPTQFCELHPAAVAVWLLAATMLAVLVTLTAFQWRLHPELARRHHHDPVMAHFYGAPPMATLTVGSGALLLGRDLIGLRLAVDLDWVLWFAGTATGLASAALVPYLMFTRPDRGRAFGGWLMPVVPPMVSAASGALLITHAPAGQARLSLIVCCYAMFGLSLLASLVVITLVWLRLSTHDLGPARLVPTLWIVLGPLGQSITAANLLGGAAALALPAYGVAFKDFGVIYGIPVWGFALCWAAIAAAITIRTARAHLPFALTWWAFTFPVGTVVTGTSALALRTGSDLLKVTAAIGYAALVLAWLVVASRTALMAGRSVAAGADSLPAVPLATARPASSGMR